eukprot:maker-scaffold274_size229011-snap-gene-1.22 protein:Tk02579 transcript:maker-scaffold274_size229011-snap-gene-1.22-mRNA-1 annotation:"hypothetical protein"
MSQYQGRLSLAAIVLVGLVLAEVTTGFRFNEGSMRPDFLGEAGLNAVPRLGRRSPSGNPFDPSRFRFRFNGPAANYYGSRLGGMAGFRFSGDEADPNQYFQLKKRMADAVKEDAKRAMDTPEDAQALDNNAPVNLMEKYAAADSYMRDYLSAMSRKAAAYDKLPAVEQSLSDLASAIIYETPLQKFLNSPIRGALGDGAEPTKAADDDGNVEKESNATSHLNLDSLTFKEQPTYIGRLSLGTIVLVGLVLAEVTTAFRFNEGSTRPDFLDEASLNAVPQLGRRSLDPSRFRFRFNGPATKYYGSRLSMANFIVNGTESGQRHEWPPFGVGYQRLVHYPLKKRMADAVKEKAHKGGR